MKILSKVCWELWIASLIGTMTWRWNLMSEENNRASFQWKRKESNSAGPTSKCLWLAHKTCFQSFSTKWRRSRLREISLRRFSKNTSIRAVRKCARKPRHLTLVETKIVNCSIQPLGVDRQPTSRAVPMPLISQQEWTSTDGHPRFSPSFTPLIYTMEWMRVWKNSSIGICRSLISGSVFKE